MKKSVISTLLAELERLVQVEQESGVEFWLARDLQAVLGYQRWENFRKVIGDAMKACETSGNKASDQFLEVTKLISHGKGGQREIQDKGATMRLGAWPCELAAGTLAAKMYGATQISERHRHRYEVNNLFLPKLVEGGLVVAGVHVGDRATGQPPLPDGRIGLVETIELKDHPFFFGCQYHPEYKSRPRAPHPVFAGFVGAALAQRKART